MNPRIVFSSLAALILASPAGFSAPSANLDKEYDQVRAIALRDSKVRAAFEKADQRLAEKIVEIDPALKGYVKGQHSSGNAHAAAAPVKTKPFVKSPKPTAPASHGSSSHVIATGDTLSTIAAHYKVTVVDLKHANPTVDEKKLQVGQKLAIPSGHRPPTNPE